jgi:hypothetical protein
MPEGASTEVSRKLLEQLKTTFHPDQEIVFPPTGKRRSRWALYYETSFPDKDPILVPSVVPTLADCDWPDESILRRPALDGSESLYLMQYLVCAVLFDTECVGDTIPVFDRNVLAGRRQRMNACTFDAFGKRITTAA